MAPSPSTLADIQPNLMTGILHGAPNPVSGALITLYTTSAGYGSTATPVATTTTHADGSFSLTLPSTSVACPSGQYAYIGAYGGTTGGNTAANPNSLLMTPIGLCDTNYTSTGGGSAYINTYVGSSLWIDELTTAVSSYALSGFMTVTSAGAINIGAPANNTSTASVTTPSAAGLAHAFANALALVNIHTGKPNAYTHGGTSVSTGGIIPDAELYLIGNILQSCVNSTGTTGTITATSNDATGCGKLFSLVTPPQTGAAVPTNTLQAMLDLVKYPNPSVNTWNAGCTAAGSGTATATNCIFGLASSIGAPYPNALQAAPPDWTLAVVYSSNYGYVSATNPGLTYPFYVATDYQDNVYVANWSAATATWTNILGFGFDGTPIFSTVEDTTNKNLSFLATDTAGHVVGTNTLNDPANVPVYSTTTGAVLNANTGAFNQNAPKAIVVDPANNLYIASTSAGINIRKFTYGGTAAAPTYTVASATAFTPALMYQMGFDANLDLYIVTSGSTTTNLYFLNNSGTSTTTPTLATVPTTLTITGDSTNAAGIAVGANNTAYVIDGSGFTSVTKTGTTAVAGSTTAAPAVNGILYNRYAIADGNSWVYSPDSANGAQVTGVSVFDSTDTKSLGTYEGCYVTTVNSQTVCGTTTATSPIYFPRAIALDSSGDIWVVSGASETLTELIGAAAPTWPGLSMAKFGRPQ